MWCIVWVTGGGEESKRVRASRIRNVRMNRSGRQNSSAIGRRECGGGRSEGADCRVLASSSMWCASGLSLNHNTTSPMSSDQMASSFPKRRNITRRIIYVSFVPPRTIIPTNAHLARHLSRLARLRLSWLKTPMSRVKTLLPKLSLRNPQTEYFVR